MYLQWTKLISTVQDAKDITLDLPPSLPVSYTHLTLPTKLEV